MHLAEIGILGQNKVGRVESGSVGANILSIITLPICPSVRPSIHPCIHSSIHPSVGIREHRHTSHSSQHPLQAPHVSEASCG